MTFSSFISNFFPSYDLHSHTELCFQDKLTTPFNNSLNEMLLWPPNIFIILNSIIDYTDKYRLLVSPQSHFCWNKQKKAEVSATSDAWVEYLGYQQKLNKTYNGYKIKKYIDVIFNINNFDKNIYDLMNKPDFCEAVFIMLVSIDKIFSKVNSGDFIDAVNMAIITRQSIILARKKLSPTLTIDKENFADNDPMNGIVAQKFNTPQSGLTLNNLTQNLSFIKPSVKYRSVSNRKPGTTDSKSNYNILIIPWPFEIKDEYFTPSNFNNLNYDMDEYFDFFDYAPAERFNPIHFLSFILSALRRTGNIDLIVFPECSLSRKQFESFANLLYNIFKENSPSLLSGVYGKIDNIGENYALLAFISDTGEFEYIRQNKHHRWFLDRNQLRNYNLALSLDPHKKWWENISVDRRNLTIFNTTNGISLCPLVCEDLARQEPVAQAVRAIGPNLVVSLLLDGPQISPRWPGKYAAVLSDDPGSSVLSVTALGMTKRSTGLGFPPSQEVALWSEPGKNSESLKVTSYTGSLMLELDLETSKMWSIDGRCEVKPILRKKMHTALDLEFSQQSVQALTLNIQKALGNRR
ncbi:hypothetical protein ACXX29_009975 [Enterobacter mori]